MCHQNCSCSDPDSPLIPSLTDHIKALQAHQASDVIRSSMPLLLSIKPIIKIILCASVETFICRSPGASQILNNEALNQMWVTTPHTAALPVRGRSQELFHPWMETGRFGQTGSITPVVQKAWGDGVGHTFTSVFPATSWCMWGTLGGLQHRYQK